MDSLVQFPKTPVECAHLVGGEWMKSAGEKNKVSSPYTGQAIGYVPTPNPAKNKVDQNLVDRALENAQQAFLLWRNIPIKERVQCLFRFRSELLKNVEIISHCTAAESGKTVAEARAGLMKGLEVVEFATSLQNMDLGGAMDVSRGVSCEYRREPLGVVLGIVPFNFPCMVPMWLYPIALALGNSFVLKPSEKVPLTSQIIGDLILKSGFPKGVFTILHGDRKMAEYLTAHPLIKAVGFVGSTPAARAVYEKAASAGKRSLCLGGAKNHIIVTPDADPEITVKGVVDSFMGCAGQRCMAASLMLAVGDVENLIDQIKTHASQIPLGVGMGALIDHEARKRIVGFIDRAEKSGARILLDGRIQKAPVNVPSAEQYQGGSWMGPTIIDQVSPDHECAQQEIFGPVLTIVRVSSLEEAMALENKHPLGNATSVFTTSGSVARYVSEKASNGMIGINIGVPVPREPFSFGGTKDSRFGSGDITGAEGVNFWSQMKKITTKWQVQKDQNWMT